MKRANCHKIHQKNNVILGNIEAIKTKFQFRGYCIVYNSFNFGKIIREKNNCQALLF